MATKKAQATKTAQGTPVRARGAGRMIADRGARNGFTIIEVVLVLAIAGLIFLMVFTALPALQRSQKDTQRKNDLSNVASQILHYQGNNNGKNPNDAATLATFKTRYLGGVDFKDPDGKEYTIELYPATGTLTWSADNASKIYLAPAKLCGETEGTTVTGKPRSYAVFMILESGIACLDNKS